MYNPFKKQEEEPSYSEAITMVHDEFNTAGEKLYQEALDIINSTHVDNIRKIERLKAIGFIATKEVVDAEHKINMKNMSLRDAKTVEYYRKRYPHNKFITEEQVREICSKYGLVYGEISLYTGFVPANQIDKIQSFSIKRKDKAWGYGSQSTWGSDKGEIIWDGGEQAERWGNIYTRVGRVNGLYIAAPIKDFNMKEKVIRKFRIVNQPVPDPVVLMAVKDGFLIVTAWGDEASDPLVQNESNN